MIITTETEIAQWVSSGVTTQVAEYFEANPGTTVSTCAAATGLSAQQVYWAIEQTGLVYLPESDTEFLASRRLGG